MSGQLFTTACLDAMCSDVSWLEYVSADVTIPTHASGTDEIASIRTVMKSEMDAEADAAIKASIKAAADQEVADIMMAEKFEYAFYSEDNSTFMIAVTSSMLSAVPVGYIQYTHKDGQDRVDNSGIYNKAVRGVRV